MNEGQVSGTHFGSSNVAYVGASCRDAEGSLDVSYLLFLRAAFRIRPDCGRTNDWAIIDDRGGEGEAPCWCPVERKR
jgi:hypothetical protein